MDVTIDPDPADLLVFAIVARELNFSAAARRLGRTRQRVSETIARLEGRLGVRLLERTTRAVRLTEAGAAYAASCAAIAAQIDEANAAVRARQSAPTGRLRISAPGLFGRRFLAPIVSRFLRRHPGVTVELSLSDRRVDLVEEGFDLAVRAGELADSALTARRIGGSRIVWVASPELLAGRPPPRPEALGGWPCVLTRPGERWELGDRALRVEAALTVDDLEVACDAAVGGAGIVRLPRFLCAAALADGRLVELFGDLPPVVRGVYAVWPSRQHVPARVRLFVDALVAEGSLVSDGP